jgi:hypothetical protein
MIRARGRSCGHRYACALQGGQLHRGVWSARTVSAEILLAVLAAARDRVDEPTA